MSQRGVGISLGPYLTVVSYWPGVVTHRQRRRGLRRRAVSLSAAVQAGDSAKTRPVEDADFSDAFCRFIHANLPTVDAAELLLVVFRHPEVAWRPAQAVERLPAGVNLSEADAAKHLQTFRSNGLAAAGPEQTFSYRPATEELNAHVKTLAKAYEERPVTLIRLIYALRDSKIRSFAEAFRLRKG
jgi:hypothetical protein